MSVIIRCPCCCLDLILPDGTDLLYCPACNTLNSRPQSTGAQLELLKRATHERLSGSYADAEQSYLSVLRTHPTEHEALWGRVLCHYGVEYVRDPRSQALHPTVHYIRSRPMQLHPDYKAALEYAPPQVAHQYRRDAAYVDDAQARIREQNEAAEPFDVFLCHKTTQADGSTYTPEYHRAIELYYELEKAGFRVFFAPLAGLAPGANYEAGIYHALSSARVLLLICADRDNLNSVWVRSEWSRYIEMMDESEAGEKRLLPLFCDGFSAADLPDEIRLRRLEGLHMGQLNSKERLFATLRKHLGSSDAEATPLASTPPRSTVPLDTPPSPNDSFKKIASWINHHINTWRIIFFPLFAYVLYELLLLLPLSGVTDSLSRIEPDNFVTCRTVYLFVAPTAAGVILWLVPKLIRNAAARFALNTLGICLSCILTCLLVSNLCWTGDYPLWETPLGVMLLIFPLLTSIVAIIVTFIVKLFFVYAFEIE